MTSPAGGSALSALSDRVRAFATGNDREAVTSAAALADAHRVVHAVRDGTLPPPDLGRALYLVAAFHWSRYLVLPPGERESAYGVAKEFFAAIAPISPERVPQPLRRPLGLEPLGDGPVDPAEAENRIAALARRGAALAARFRHRPQPGDAEAAVTAYREAVALARAAADPQTPVLIANLAGTLLLHGSADPDVLDEIVTMIDEALPDADERGTNALLSNLAIALRQRFQLRQRHDDLVRSAEACRRRAELLPPEGSASANALATLAAVRGTLFEVAGRPADLTAAVAAARAAVAARDPDRMRRAGYLTNLGNLLRIRYDQHRSRDDLDEAVAVCAEAIDLAPDRRDVAAMWSNSSAALRERFRLAGDPADLTAAIDAARRGLGAAPPGDPFFAPCATHLGCALLDRHFLAGTRDDPRPGLDDVREAVRMLRAALTALEPEHRFHGPASVNLGVGLRTLFEGTGDRADLDAAVLAGRAGHTAVHDDDPSRALDALNLAQSLRSRFEASGDHRDAREAAEMFREAAEAAAAPARVRLDAARAWADLESALRFGSAGTLAAYRAAVALMPVLAWRGLPATDRENLLAGCAGLVDDAAAAAIEAGHPEAAVELLDGGRAVLWASWLATRGDLAEVTAVAPELGARLHALRAVLDEASPALPTGPRAGEQRMAAAQQWESTVAEVRGLPGMSGFLRLPSFAELRAGLPDGTAVIVTVSRHRCDALLVDRDGVRVVRLPELTFDDAYDRTNELLAAHEAADRGRDFAAHDLAISATLSWLWDAVVAPVLAELRVTRPGHRVWWCPTGPLVLLPLHAATSADGLECALDRVVSSYTPTVRMLADAGGPDAGTPATEILAVIQPATPGLPPLPNAVRELAALRELTGGELTELSGGAATRADVAALVARHRVAHFSCHGTQNPRDPSRSGLAVHDGFLTVADLRAVAPGPRGDFAFLSACKTAAGGVRLLDEALTVAGALHHVGYRRVVGTLWSVPDRPAAEVSIGVYRRIIGSGRLDAAASAGALHEAVRQVRRRFPLMPGLWASYVHIGR